jgi:hypothetical protein
VVSGGAKKPLATGTRRNQGRGMKISTVEVGDMTVGVFDLVQWLSRMSRAH